MDGNAPPDVSFDVICALPAGQWTKLDIASTLNFNTDLLNRRSLLRKRRRQALASVRAPCWAGGYDTKTAATVSATMAAIGQGQETSSLFLVKFGAQEAPFLLKGFFSTQSPCSWRSSALRQGPHYKRILAKQSTSCVWLLER